MTDISKALPFVVECRSFAKFFEPIAAFNDERVARSYAMDCWKANPSFSYRIDIFDKFFAIN